MGDITTLCDYQKPIVERKDASGSKTLYYSAVYEGLPDEFKRIAEKELNETDENRKKGLHKLKSYMKSKDIRVLEDNVLLTILRNSKFDLKKSEAKLKRFLIKRREIIKMLAQIDTDTIKDILDDFGIGILPYRDKHGRAIMYTRPCGINTEKYDASDVVVLAAVATLFFMRFPLTSVAGYAYFGECKSPSLYAQCIFLKALKQVVFHVLSFPVRLSKIEVLNTNYACVCFVKAISPFMKKKIIERITLHGVGYSTLHKDYDPDMLPEEFDGKMRVSNEVYKQKLLDFVQQLKEEIE